jgi:hypothetical protein
MMRRNNLIPALLTAWLFSSAIPVDAQFHPGYRDRYGNYTGRAYYGYGYGYDGWGGYGGGSTYNTAVAAASANQIAGEQAAMQQRMATQNKINSALAANAQQRTAAIQGRQQSNRDWWFQVQQQQMAERQANDARYNARLWQTYGPAASAAGFESSVSSSTTPAAASDIIQWPPILRNSGFAAQRARIEAPYRRDKGLTNPTVKDYETMIDATEKMKEILKSKAADISALTYLNADAFLDQLADEARGRIKKNP